ncbi:MAG: hypothetical protein C0496_17615, partial [Erythrobacter sp.]|nr:hypothetical protein [Erythrobacter sp.]
MPRRPFAKGSHSRARPDQELGSTCSHGITRRQYREQPQPWQFRQGDRAQATHLVHHRCADCLPLP